MTAKNDLIEYTRQVQGYTNDCRTFTWSRAQYGEQLKDPALRLGGGNLLMVQGLFAGLNYLAKIYVLLTGKEKLNRRGHVVESEAFSSLILASPTKLGLDALDKNKLKKFWNDWRNQLAHWLVMRNGQAWAFDYDLGNGWWKGNYPEFLKRLCSGEKQPFLEEEGRWHCYVDILPCDVDKIGDWLCGVIDHSTDTIALETLSKLEGYLAGTAVQSTSIYGAILAFVQKLRKSIILQLKQTAHLMSRL